MNWDAARQAVRDEIHTQRPDLVLEQDIADFLGINLVTTRHFFNGRVATPRGTTRAKIEDALGWERHTLERIARGRASRPERPQDALRARIRAAVPSATEAEVDALLRELNEYYDGREPSGPTAAPTQDDTPKGGERRRLGER